MIRQLLLVDDDPKFRAIVSLAASEFDCHVTQASNLHEANLELQIGNYDLLVVDGRFPDGDGLEWISELRKRGLSTKIVFISGHLRSSSSFGVLKHDLKVDAVLQKPVSIKTLAREFGKLFDLENKTVSSEFHKEMQELESQYKEDLPLRINELSEVLERLFLSPDDQGLLCQAERQAHMMKGNSGSFGLVELGENMGKIEERLQSFSKAIKIFPSLVAINKLVEVEKLLEIVRVGSKEELNQGSESSNMEDASQKIPTLHSPSVLVIDRDRDFSQRLASLLSADGFLVYSFDDPLGALDLVNELKADLLLVDLQNCENDAFCRKIGALTKRNNKKVIALTASSDSVCTTRMAETGVKVSLSKKRNNIEILEELHSHLDALNPNRRAMGVVA